jgi:hypothetical protein
MRKLRSAPDQLSTRQENIMVKEFAYKGHTYKVVGIENNEDEFIIIRDGMNTRRVKKEIAEKAREHVDELF